MSILIKEALIEKIEKLRQDLEKHLLTIFSEPHGIVQLPGLTPFAKWRSTANYQYVSRNPPSIEQQTTWYIKSLQEKIDLIEKYKEELEKFNGRIREDQCPD